MQKQIISASRRTDIPAFFTHWLKNRLNAGFCTVVNPYNMKQVSTVSLLPEDVRFIVFWTKNPGNLLDDTELFSHLERDYSFYFLFTLIGYPELLEPGTHTMKEQIMDSFLRLAERIGRKRVIWRYDPIIISSLTDYDYHRRNFSNIASRLSGSTERVILSVVDIYKTVEKRFNMLRNTRGIIVKSREELSCSPQFFETMQFLREIAEKEGMKIQTCSEASDFSPAGIYPGSCIDNDLISHIVREKDLAGSATPESEEIAYQKDQGQRSLCLCTISRDIGAPHTCGHKCLYCYASPGDPLFTKTDGRRRILTGGEKPGSPDSHEFHNPDSPSLYGWFE